jgi:hypothetical protein
MQNLKYFLMQKHKLKPRQTIIKTPTQLHSKMSLAKPTNLPKPIQSVHFAQSQKQNCFGQAGSRIN